MNKQRVFIIHGWEGCPEEGWFPWLKKELEKRDFEVYIPQMPNPDEPQLSEWLKKISEVVEMPDEQTFFVGHSLGCYTIAKYLEGLERGVKIGGAVFVAGFSGRLNIPELENFYKNLLNWEKIKSHTEKFIAIHSDDDPYVPIERGEELKEKLKAKLVIQKGMKHFSGEEGIFELPIVLDSLLEIANNI
jgi:predicted alpha/beta hydrolase family esterase